MATCHLSDDESSSEDGVSDLSDYDTGSSDESNCQPQSKPCKYYNSGQCRDGHRCSYLHVCQYALKGHCRYGSSCKLKHPTPAKASSHASKWAPDPSAKDPKLTNGRPYQWQLHDGKGWKDVENDHIIEAQYCLPHTKSIKIYNTPYGAISIDFNRMRVHGKRLGVRRLDDGRTAWTWYCSLRRKWRKYDDKDSKGNSGPVKSSDIETKFQSDPSGSISFIIGNDTFNIKFTEMRQVSQKKKRRVCRRPVYRQAAGAGAGASQAASALKRMSLGATWEFQGKHGWHKFKQSNVSGCSVTSDDIEREYQKDRSGSMSFHVNGQSYKLDFKAMTQTNLSTNKSRKVRRV
ncbi:uncharacterized protein si:ch211-244b2.4 isoform X2 [Betta splendens]|uniref:Uncharacterized protein si:ch211-244b2.4 isoform X2 n=1 Tax=Betta splendens TaxID=158456 RepID=A0A6P7NIP6_BETSP|nr:uncharacterized protein si:ch211-244b2.4 isoform X2 [Betta splendens]